MGGASTARASVDGMATHTNMMSQDKVPLAKEEMSCDAGTNVTEWSSDGATVT